MLLPVLATYTALRSGDTAISAGETPTRTVDTVLRVAPSMTETVLSSWLLT